MTDYRTIEQLREELKRRYAAADWSQVKLAVFKKDGFKCRTCGRSRKLRAHHKTYAHLWDELNYLEDMATQCKDCHRQGTYGDYTISQDQKALFWLKVTNASGRAVFWLFWAILRSAWWITKKTLLVVGFLALFILTHTIGTILLLLIGVTRPIWKPILIIGLELYKFKKDIS